MQVNVTWTFHRLVSSDERTRAVVPVHRCSHRWRNAMSDVGQDSGNSDRLSYGRATWRWQQHWNKRESQAKSRDTWRSADWKDWTAEHIVPCNGEILSDGSVLGRWNRTEPKQSQNWCAILINELRKRMEMRRVVCLVDGPDVPDENQSIDIDWLMRSVNWIDGSTSDPTRVPRLDLSLPLSIVLGSLKIMSCARNSRARESVRKKNDIHSGMRRLLHRRLLLTDEETHRWLLVSGEFCYSVSREWRVSMLLFRSLLTTFGKYSFPA